eukprot:TRINITY_DN10273_c0_g1_i1.p1 TRINITY_DN10273_c0_g1~~TRINITY_DN10273_c0_g1_i1.p1  ORF type:complete len:191 (-),score=42.19 TRINITY_DN10273_c0_g1_i1:755-1327(-)
MLPSQVEVVVVRSRVSKAFDVETVEYLASYLKERKYLIGSFFFGHSIGAVEAFIAAWRRVGGAGAAIPPPCGIILSAMSPPTLPNWHTAIPPSVIESPDVFTPLLRNAHVLTEHLVSLPLLLFAGATDKFFPADAVSQWCTLTTTVPPAQCVVVPGSHLFINSQKELLVERISRFMLMSVGCLNECHPSS